MSDVVITVNQNSVVTVDENTIQIVAPIIDNQIVAIVEQGLQGAQGATGAGVPTGGTTGQVLAKASGTNYDTQWVDILGGLSYRGAWNASTNTPALASGVGTNGFYYVVSVAGSTNLNGITDWAANDWAIFNGTAWQKIDNSETGAVWGSITGTLANQTDLQNALNAKQNTLSIGSPANGISISAAILSLARASTSATGALSATDWNTFNSKQAAITTGTTAQYLRGDLSLATFPTLVSSFTNDAGYLTSAALTPYVPYTGATADVDLGTFSLIAEKLSLFNSPYQSDFYVQSNGALLVGDISGNTRGARALDLQTSRASGADKVASGQDSVCIGGNNKASALGTVAMGYDSSASGENGYAIGRSAQSSGYGAGTIGSGNASGNYSFAAGGGTASGYFSAAFGYTVVAGGDFTTCIGANFTLNDAYSFGFGINRLYYKTDGTTNRFYGDIVANSDQLGTEKLVNGNFGTGDLTGWTVTGTKWSYNSTFGGMRHTNSGTNGVAYQASGTMVTPIVAGVEYTLTYTVNQRSSGGVFASLGSWTGITRTAIGTYTETFTAPSVSDLTFNSSTTSASFTVIDISLKAVIKCDVSATRKIYAPQIQATTVGGYLSSDGSSGITATITTAKLTTIGTGGSMTFKDGILTAQTQAT